jgi:hypothetical protein
LDPIPASKPSELEEELRLRVEQKDRYGQKRRPFYLLWPTDYSVVTQKFGANPHIYSRFGMPGHEGIDIRALTNTNIYCCADGEVYLVHTNPKSHAYGIHVRIRHKDGYKTVYAHLATPLVKVGELVEAGQIIGKADSTGASTGSHLHMTLKRDGATKRGETKYPKDVIDPTPYLVWPERTPKTMRILDDLPFERCMRGVHPRVEGILTEQDVDTLIRLKPEAVILDIKSTSTEIERLKKNLPETFILGRISADLSAEPLTPKQFLGMCTEDLVRCGQLGIRYYEIGKNPNLQSHGFGRSWRTGYEYSQWFIQVLDQFRKIEKEALFGFPGLSPGEAIPGWRANDQTFLEEADAAALAADWIGVHAFWLDRFEMQSPSGGRVFESYRNRFPDKLLFITEFNNPSPGLSPKQRAQQYHAYFEMIDQEPGIGAAFLYALTAEDPEIHFVIRQLRDADEDWLRILGSTRSELG